MNDRSIARAPTDFEGVKVLSFLGVFPSPPAFMSISHARVFSSTFSSSTYSRNMCAPCAFEPATWRTRRAILSIAASNASRPSPESAVRGSFFPSRVSPPPPPEEDSNVTNSASMFFLMFPKMRSRGATTSLVVTIVSSALTITSSTITNSTIPMFSIAVHLLTSAMSSSSATQGTETALVRADDASPPETSREETNAPAPQSPLESTRRSADLGDLGYVSVHCHTFPANASATGLRSDREKNSKNPPATAAATRADGATSSDDTAARLEWYAAGIVSESSQSNRGAAKIVSSTTIATLLLMDASKSAAIFPVDVCPRLARAVGARDVRRLAVHGLSRRSVATERTNRTRRAASLLALAPNLAARETRSVVPISAPSGSHPSLRNGTSATSENVPIASMKK